MASTYSSNLKIELMGTGENAGTWGNITNTNLGTALEQAVVGLGNPDFVADADLTITITNSNAAQAARALVLNVTSAFGSLTATRELVVPTSQKQYIVQNNTTGDQSITVKTSGGTGITVPNGRKAHLYVDGTNVIQMFDFVDINGGAIDGTTVGAAAASTGAFTSLAASGTTTLSGLTASTALALDASKNVVSVTNTGTGNNVLATSPTLVTPALGTPASGVVTNLTGTASININGTVGATTPAAGAFTTLNTSGAVTFNDAGANVDFRVEGDTDANLLFVDASADAVGIGTSSPGGRLHIASATNADGLRIQNTSSANSTDKSTRVSFFGTDTGSSVKEAANIYTLPENANYIDTALTFQTRRDDVVAERMRITSAGNVGIGTSSPDANSQLSLFSTNYPSLFLNNNSTTGGGAIRFAKQGTQHGLIASSGWILADTSSDISLQAGTGLGLRFYTDGNTERMRIDSSGNVGIGTSSPGTKLEVSRGTTANANATGATTRTNSAFAIAASIDTNSRVMFGIDTNTNGWVQVQNTNSNGVADFIINPVGGNLGLGVTPSAWSSAFRALQISSGCGVFGITSDIDNVGVVANAVFDATDGRWEYIGSGFATFYQQDAGQHIWNTAPSGTAGNAISFTERMRIDSAGNVGVSASALIGAGLGYAGNTTAGGAGSLELYNGGSGNTTLSNSGPYALIFNTNATERARIDSSGNLLVGKTSANTGTDGVQVTLIGGGRLSSSASSADCATFNRNTSNGTLILMLRGGLIVGSIDVTTTATSYVTSSDYRLKHDIQPMSGALAKVAQLKPVTYKWNVDDSHGEGFIAHEIQEVAPYAVSGEKDGEQMQGVDYGKITPLLTAALQEAIAEIQSLKARVAELEAK
jgi:predicted outer membrane repeat protein